MKRIIQELNAQADLVIFDSPPVGGVADTLAFCTLIDGVLVVNNVGQTYKHELKQTVEAVERVYANLIVMVLN